MKYHVEFDVETEGMETTDRQAIEWIRYMVGDTGKLSNENPLADKPFDPIFGTIKIERRDE